MPKQSKDVSNTPENGEQAANVSTTYVYQYAILINGKMHYIDEFQVWELLGTLESAWADIQEHVLES